MMHHDPKAKRLASMILMLKTSTSQTASQLAEALRVTVRTIYRDLDELMAAGVPIRGTRGPTGGYELAEYFPVDPFVYVSADPPAFLSTPRDKSTLRAIAATASYLTEFLPETVRDRVSRSQERFLFDTSAWLWKDSDIAYFSELKQAVLNDQMAEIIYLERGTREIRTQIVNPYGLVWRQGHWYLVAYSQESRQFERYRIQRIIGVVLVGKKFDREPRFDLAQMWVRLLEDFGTGGQQVRIKINFPATKDFESFVWKRDQKISKFTDHWIVEMELDRDDWLIPLALSYGDKLQILEPASLRDRIASALESALALYRGGPQGQAHPRRVRA